MKHSIFTKTVLSLACAGMTLPAYAGVATINGQQVDTLDWVTPAGAPLVTDRTKSNNTVNTRVLGANALQLQGRESELNLDTPIEAGESHVATVLDPTTAPLVIGFYNPTNSTLRIEIVKVEKVGRSPLYYAAQFSPRHGSIWRFQKTYLDNGTAIDPFAQWQDPNNAPVRDGSNPNAPGNLFVNISLGGVEAALAHAMKLVKAPTAVLAIGSYRIATWTETTGKRWNKKKHYHYQAFGKVDWATMTAPTVQEGGLHAWTCAKAVETPADCAPSLRMPTLMRFQRITPIPLEHRNAGIKTPSGGFCVEGEAGCEDELYHDVITQKKNWTKIAGMALVGFAAGGFTGAAILGRMEGNAQGEAVRESPGTPGANEMASLSAGSSRQIDINQEGETRANSMDLKYGSPSIGTPVSAGDQWNDKANTLLTARMNTTVFSPTLLSPIRYFINNSGKVDEYGTMGKTKKLLGTFNTYNPNSTTVEPGDYRNSGAGTSTNDSTTTQSQTRTQNKKGPAAEQRRAAS